MTLTELERLAEEATDGPWNTGPETGAGEVWVYCGNMPLAEPSRDMRDKIRRVFRLRSDSNLSNNWTPRGYVANEDPFWKQKQRDAALIVAIRNDCDALIAIAKAGAAVLYHDERGQGIGYAESMKALGVALKQLEGT